MAIQRVEPLKLGDLLGSLMGAVVDAQAQAARASIEFVRDVGLISEQPSGTERLRTVSLRYRKRDENGALADFEVEVPLLAMVNVPSLAVKEASFSMAYDVVTVKAASDTTKRSVMTGVIRKKTAASDRKTTTMSVDVEVTIAQEATPIGVERLFDLAELGITEALVEGNG
ncbi:DUF2589 domain-containing protein [Nocardia amamiensis]|uniref:DUF2589 domain-containing protein n=1 Tax=Nocardia amamiensis TaxID=404578 RepID=UPI000ABC8C69|nr:DUF2589 domain-containing protein [Nocardia amamiensis]